MDYERTQSGILVPASSAKRPDLREIATTQNGRDITRGYVDPMMLQRPEDSVLQLRGNSDYKIYKEVLRDDQVAATFAQRRLAVIGCEWEVEAGGNSRADKKAADLLREQLDEVGFDRATDLMLYGIFYGYAVAEIMWGRDGANITFDKIKVRERRRFGFDGFGNLRLKTSQDINGEIMPDRKFWHYCTGADHDDEPYGLGLAHWCYWPVFFKRNGLSYWMTFLERFGQPTAKGVYPAGATKEERKTLLEALDAISTDTGIAIPQGMEIAFLEAARSGTADYSKVCEHMDNAISKIVLGQTASTQGTPGRLGNDDLQGDVRSDLTRADADLACESFNRAPVKWLTEYNYPGANPPRVFRVTDPEEDQDKKADRDKKIYDMGFKPTLKHITDEYGGEWQERKESAEPSVPGVVPGAEPAPTTDFAEPDTSKAKTLTDQLDDRLQGVTDVWINRIRELVMKAESMEALRDGLAALLPDMKPSEYASVMGEALRLAELNGRSDIMDEVASAS